MLKKKKKTAHLNEITASLKVQLSRSFKAESPKWERRLQLRGLQNLIFQRKRREDWRGSFELGRDAQLTVSGAGIRSINAKEKKKKVGYCFACRDSSE